MTDKFDKILMILFFIGGFILGQIVRLLHKNGKH